MRTSPGRTFLHAAEMGVFLKVNLPPARVPGKQDFAYRLPDERPATGGVAAQPCGKLRIRRNGDVPAIQNNGFAVPALRDARVVEVYRNMPKQLAGGRRRHDQHGLSGRECFTMGYGPTALGFVLESRECVCPPTNTSTPSTRPASSQSTFRPRWVSAMTMFTPCARSDATASRKAVSAGPNTASLQGEAREAFPR